MANALLFSFINEMFNFCINNVVGKPIIKCLFYIFKFIEEDRRCYTVEDLFLLTIFAEQNNIICF